MWSEHGSVWKFKSRLWIKREKAGRPDITTPRKLLMLDLDGTIITTASGKKFPKDANDWKWRWAQVPNTLQKYARTCSIVVVTNQSGLSNKSKKNLPKAQTDFKTKVEHIARELAIPFILYVATANDVYRKPSPLLFEDYIINDVPMMSRINYIMYVGDAAGRKDDFADSDRQFAANIALNIKNIDGYISKQKIKPKIAFKTPEEFFLKESPSNKVTQKNQFEPKKFLNSYDKKNTELSYFDLISPSSEQELILMVGPPASGKSQLSKLLAAKWPNYVRFSQDEHKSKTPKLVKEALLAGDSVIVDNQHYTKSARAKYIKIISDIKNADDVKNIKTRIIMTLGYSGSPSDKSKFDLYKKDVRTKQIAIAKHLNMVREKKNARAGYPTPSRMISRVVYNKYNADFEYPTEDEGIDEIIQVPFIPKFENDRDLVTFLEQT